MTMWECLDSPACRLQDVLDGLRTQQMPDLSAELRGIDTGYRAARPCMLALLARIAHINASVVALPDSIAVRTPWLGSSSGLPCCPKCTCWCHWPISPYIVGSCLT